MINSKNEYSDIIGRPHHVSYKRPRMARASRAAQFSPFSALTGYEDLIVEAARHTDTQRIVDDTQKEELDRILNFLLHQEQNIEAEFTFFQPDSKKHGGEYVTEKGIVVSYDEFGQTVTFNSGKTVPINHIFAIRCDALPFG